MKSEFLKKAKRNVPLASLTTFKIGGRAKYFFAARNEEELIEAIKWARAGKLPFFILGSGSNLLVSDKGFNGLVIMFQVPSFRFQDNEIYAEAGIKLSDLVKEAAKRGLRGFEWAVGIPGTLGGAIYGNAGAFGRSISEMIEEVKFLNKRLQVTSYRLQVTSCRLRAISQKILLRWK